MKLQRKALKHYLDYTFKRELKSAAWEVLGDDIEDMSVELNPDTDQKENILGQIRTSDKGYKPSISADPYYADSEKKIYPKIREIAMDRLRGDKCKTYMLEVIVEDTSAAKQLAYVQEVMVKPQSYGGDTEGVDFPFNILEDGERIKGYVTSESLNTDSPVFTEGAIEAA